MFVEITTTKGEKASINFDKVILFGASKKGLIIVTDDGNLFETNDDYEAFRSQIISTNSKS